MPGVTVRWKRIAGTLSVVCWLMTFGSIDARQADALSEVRELRLRGDFEEARAAAERELDRGPLDPLVEIALRLELARVHDTIGLHRNTRPVPAALEQIEAAASLMKDPPPDMMADIALARAEYDYGAEIEEREFRATIRHADRASELYRRLGDRHGEADALHRRGLVHLQRGEHAEARALFDRSLELDDAGGERAIFRGDYERHVGYLYLFQGNVVSAVGCFERSLSYRRRAGDMSASLFAANTLSSVLVDLDRLDEARSHLLFAMMLAEKLGSPTGKARNGLVAAELYERAGDEEAARAALEMTLEIASAIGDGSIERQARTALERLTAPD